MSTMAKCVNLLGQLMHNLRAFIINRTALRVDYILPSLEISLGTLAHVFFCLESIMFFLRFG